MKHQEGPPNPVEHGSTEVMAEFGRKAGIIVHRLTTPVEILNHLLYLANNSDDPQKVRQYVAEAREQARIVASAHLDLLKAYPGPKPETT